MRFIPRFSITNAIAAVLTVIDGRMAVAAEGVGAGNANPPFTLRPHRPSARASGRHPDAYKPFQLRISPFLSPVTTSVTTPVLPGISSRHSRSVC